MATMPPARDEFKRVEKLFAGLQNPPAGFTEVVAAGGFSVENWCPMPAEPAKTVN